MANRKPEKELKLIVLTKTCGINGPRYMKQPALKAPRTLAAVSDEVATDAPIMTPIKLVQATDVHVGD